MKLRNLAFVLLAGGALLSTPRSPAADNPALMEPAKSVYARYLKTQTALAQDSLEGVAENAGAIAQAIRNDAMKMMAPEIARDADTLAGATDLRTARAAFKLVSNGLIRYLAQNKVSPGPYYQAFCPMAKANWLQAGQTIHNPYLGKAMVDCGQLLPAFSVPKSTPGSGHSGHAGHGMTHEQ